MVIDLTDTLRALGAADDGGRVDVDAGFFHRTLARWLGLPEGDTSVRDPVRWDYGYWKATFEPLGKHDDDGRERFAAELFRSKDGAPERVSWFVKKDARGRIVEAGWLGDAPRLVEDGDVGGADSTDDVPALDATTVARLLDDDTEPERAVP